MPRSAETPPGVNDPMMGAVDCWVILGGAAACSSRTRATPAPIATTKRTAPKPGQRCLLILTLLSVRASTCLRRISRQLRCKDSLTSGKLARDRRTSLGTEPDSVLVNRYRHVLLEREIEQGLARYFDLVTLGDDFRPGARSTTDPRSNGRTLTTAGNGANDRPDRGPSYGSLRCARPT